MWPVSPQSASTVTVAPTMQPPQIQMRPADKSKKFIAQHQALYKYPDRWAAKAKKTVQCLIPLLAKNTSQYRLSDDAVRRNLHLVTQDYATKGCPKSWWKRLLYLGGSKSTCPETPHQRHHHTQQHTTQTTARIEPATSQPRPERGGNGGGS